MIDVVGVAFQANGRTYYFSPNNLKLTKGAKVIVETERGQQYGEIVIENKQINHINLVLPLKNIIREATEADGEMFHKNTEDSRKAIETCRKLAQKYKMPMNLIDANFTFDRKQLMFRFTAEDRIDFRELVKELASIYKTRIELRQIGVRDKAKEVGGIGPCGRVLCCSNFLYNFDMVSINMAKNQNIALNPGKINGSCGRLLCCLTYENDDYTQAKIGMPSIGDVVEIPGGKGRVITIDILNRKYKVEIDEHSVLEMEAKVE
jgi:cell fate regulator YaaT (PSP1 superfamily)